MSRKKKPQGFATMDPERQRKLSRLGGRAVHAQGTGHEWTPDEARIARAQRTARTRERRRGPTKGGA